VQVTAHELPAQPPEFDDLLHHKLRAELAERLVADQVISREPVQEAQRQHLAAAVRALLRVDQAGHPVLGHRVFRTGDRTRGAGVELRAAQQLLQPAAQHALAEVGEVAVVHACQSHRAVRDDRQG
jgi:hypothetical protein